MRKQCRGDWRPFSSIRISKYKTGLRCDRQPIWNQYLFTGRSEKRGKTERFLSTPKHRNSKANIWNMLHGQQLEFFSPRVRNHPTELSKCQQYTKLQCYITVYQQQWHQYRDFFVLLYQLQCQMTRTERQKVADKWVALRRFQVQISLRDVRTVVDIHRAKTTRQAMYV